MNDGDSAGRRHNSTSPPAVIDRKSTTKLLEATDSAASVAQMSQLQTTRPQLQSTESQNSGNESVSSETEITIFGGQTQQKIGQTIVNASANSVRLQHMNTGNGTRDTNRTNETVSMSLQTTTPSITTTVATNVSIESSGTIGPTTNLSTSTSLITTTTSGGSVTRKRNANSPLDADSIISFKKRNLSHRLNKLKQIKEKYTEHVAEIYFLQTGGNMMDYTMWRKKTNTPDFLNFLKQYRLDPAPQEQTTPVTNSS